MLDPLSIAGSLVGLASLGTNVTLSLIRFFNSYVQQDSELCAICGNLEDLLDTFHNLRSTLHSRQFQQDEADLITSLETWIDKAVKLIQDLEDKCQKFQKLPSDSLKSKIKTQGNRLTYYFQKDALVKLNRNIAEARNTLSLALDLLNARDHQQTLRSIEETRALVELVRVEQISSELYAWLKAPDATVEHNAACAKKHPGTGLWFTNSPQFLTWLTEENSVIWLRGFAGSGKSVLCSTAIQSVFRRSSISSRIGIAFFYFTFRDQSKQDEIAMLRALLLQLSTQLKTNHKHLRQLKKTYEPGTPPASVLIQYLRLLCEEFFEVFVAIDALDESPRDGPRQRVLDVFETIRSWKIQRLHFLITSRNEPDIVSCLELPTSQQVLMANKGLDQDISEYIESRLDTDRRLRKWNPYRRVIANVLSEKAKGMFRWVECQLHSLQHCPRSQGHLDRLLNSLPSTLAETYERIFRDIDPSLIEDARRILTLLCFTSRPLKVSELIEGVAVDVNQQVGPHHKRRLEDHQDILFICPILVEIYPGQDPTFRNVESKLIPIARIAHSSVQQCLLSSCTRLEKPTEFHLDSFTAYKEILHICLIYLLDKHLWDRCHGVLEKGRGKTHEERFEMYLELGKEYPLAYYAALEWCLLYKKISCQTDELDFLVLKLFEEQRSLQACAALGFPSKYMVLGLSRISKTATPVYYASYWGLTRIVKIMMGLACPGTGTDGASSSSLKVDTCCDVNAGGLEGSPLTVAISQGHAEIVRLLLDKGADVNAAGESSFRRPLQAAIVKDDEELVHELLEKGAKAHDSSGFWGEPVSSAHLLGNERIIRLLREYGANDTQEDTSLRSSTDDRSQNDLPEDGKDLLRKIFRLGIEFPHGYSGKIPQLSLFRLQFCGTGQCDDPERTKQGKHS